MLVRYYGYTGRYMGCRRACTCPYNGMCPSAALTVIRALVPH